MQTTHRPFDADTYPYAVPPIRCSRTGAVTCTARCRTEHFDRFPGEAVLDEEAFVRYSPVHPLSLTGFSSSNGLVNSWPTAGVQAFRYVVLPIKRNSGLVFKKITGDKASAISC